RFVEHQLLVARIEINAAIFTEAFNALAAVETSYFMGGGFHGAVVLDNVRRGAVEDDGRGAFAKFLGHRLPDFGIVAIWHRLPRRTARHWPRLGGLRPARGSDKAQERQQQS